MLIVRGQLGLTCISLEIFVATNAQVLIEFLRLDATTSRMYLYYRIWALSQTLPRCNTHDDSGIFQIVCHPEFFHRPLLWTFSPILKDTSTWKGVNLLPRLDWMSIHHLAQWNSLKTIDHLTINENVVIQLPPMPGIRTPPW